MKLQSVAIPRFYGGMKTYDIQTRQKLHYTENKSQMCVTGQLPLTGQYDYILGLDSACRLYVYLSVTSYH